MSQSNKHTAEEKREVQGQRDQKIFIVIHEPWRKIQIKESTNNR